MNKNLFIVALLVPLFLAQTPPVLPQQYELGFSEKASIGPISGTTTGRIFLDAVHNQQLITRANGHHDRYCGTVYKFADTPCNHIIMGSKYILIWLR